jgi:glycosyltransferase involved in cell wall biosynthesis
LRFTFCLLGGARAVKVALLTSSRERCGIARYSRDLYAELSRLVDATLVPIQPWPPEGERLARLRDADVVHLQHEYSFWGTAFPPPGSYYEGLDLFRKPGRLVITAHTVAEAETVVAARAWAPKPLVKRAALQLRPGLRREIEAAPFLPGDRIIVHSAAAAASLATRLEGQTVVQHWPMPVQSWSVRASKWGPLSVQYGLHGRRLITVFGFVTREKGYGLALRAMQRIHKMHPEALLLIAGGAREGWGEAFLGYLRRAEQRIGTMPAAPVARAPEPVPVVGILRSLVEETTDREPPYRATGYLEDADARAILEQTEIALLPYRSATGSYAAGAALAAGCPLLTSDLPAFAEPLPALRFRSGDVEDLVQKLDQLLSDEPARVRLIARSQRYAEENSWARSAERHVALYHELLGDEV